MASKIVITHDDLRDPRVDEVIERERVIREVAARAQPVGGLRRLFFSSVFYLGLVGALGGFLGWAALEPSWDDEAVVSGTVKEVEPARAIVACPKCKVGARIEVNAGGGWNADTCPNCRTELDPKDIVARGLIRVGDVDVFVLPKRTRLVVDGKPRLLDSADEIQPGDRVRIEGEVIQFGAGGAVESLLAAEQIAPLPAGAPEAARQSDLRALEGRRKWVGWLWFGLIGGLIALLIGAVEGLMSLNPRQALLSGLVGLGIGFGGGVAGTLPANLLYGVARDVSSHLADNREVASVRDLHGWPLFSQIVGRSLAWGLVGLAIGLGRGVSMKSRRLIVHGLIGGCLGGLFGGLLFDPIGKLADSETGDLSRAVGFTTVGLFVGLCLGIVEQLAKEAWLLMRTGPLQGKQFVVHRSPTSIGGQGQCDIFLFRDPKVQPEHARLHRVGRAYEIEDLGTSAGTLVNGQRVQRRILRDGDTITIGSTELEYRSRGG